VSKKSIFITGAALGIGRETARVFTQQGWFVGIYDINTDAVTALVEELGTGNAIGDHLDVCDYSEFQQRLAQFSAASDGRLDVLFNNAGILTQGRFDELSIETHHRTLDVNIKGVVNGTYAALDLLKETPGACVLSMCSASAVYGTPDHSTYSASKFAVRAITEALDVELQQYDIKVCDLMPSFVATNMVLGQEHQSSMVGKLGIDHQPQDIAQLAWQMVHSNRLHWQSRSTRILSFLAGVLPKMVRRKMQQAIE